jgi:hypothetical protein
MSVHVESHSLRVLSAPCTARSTNRNMCQAVCGARHTSTAHYRGSRAHSLQIKNSPDAEEVTHETQDIMRHKHTCDKRESHPPLRADASCAASTPSIPCDSTAFINIADITVLCPFTYAGAMAKAAFQSPTSTMRLQYLAKSPAPTPHRTTPHHTTPHHTTPHHTTPHVSSPMPTNRTPHDTTASYLSARTWWLPCEDSPLPSQ